MNTDMSDYIYRKEADEISLDSPLAQVVTGVRRCGKSTLCKKKMMDSGVRYAYVNFDDDRLYGMATDGFEHILSALYRINGRFTHLFLDEAQNIPGWELFVNRMLRQGMKLVITGSNANLLNSELTTHLVGRFNEIKLFPFTFSEFCHARDVNVESITTEAQALRMRALQDYMFTGGFPEVVNGIAPLDYVVNLVNTIIYKDICARYRVHYSDALWKLANITLDRSCQEISATAVAKELGLRSFHTVDKYIKYLSDTYLLTLIKRFSWKSDERRRLPKAYAMDPAFLYGHDGAIQTQSLGWRLENVVALELLNRNDKVNDRVYYLKKNRNYEVDFAVMQGIHPVELIQVTYDFTKPRVKLYNREVGGLMKASKEMNCDNLTLVVMEGERKDLCVEGKRVKVRIAADWLNNIRM